MATLVLGSPPHELEALLARRRQSGLDQFDEVWEGVLHLIPAPSHAHGDLESQLHAILRPLARQGRLMMTGQVNIGASEHDFRVPDAALHRPGAGGVWHPTAALVVEIVSVGDESWQKLPFYAAHAVEEVVVVEPAQHLVSWLARRGRKYEPVERSALVQLGAAELVDALDWP